MSRKKSLKILTGAPKRFGTSRRNVWSAHTLTGSVRLHFFHHAHTMHLDGLVADAEAVSDTRHRLRCGRDVPLT